MKVLSRNDFLKGLGASTLLVAAGCTTGGQGRDAGRLEDGGTSDGGTGPVDGGHFDAGGPDSGMVDSNDAGAVDGGIADAGMSDDAGAPCEPSPTSGAGPFINTGDNYPVMDIAGDRVGTPLTIQIHFEDCEAGPIVGADIEVWYCDASGTYSEYSNNGNNRVGQSYLRGVQATNEMGAITMQGIYPGWYPGRATHIHARLILPSGQSTTYQIAFPDDISSAVHTQSSYEGQNTTSNAQDGFFGANPSQYLAEVGGSLADGFVFAKTIRI